MSPGLNPVAENLTFIFIRVKKGWVFIDYYSDGEYIVDSDRNLDKLMELN